MRVAGLSGFTLAEAMVAVVVVSAGVLALVGSAALTSRMIGRGLHGTRAGQTAASRIERLRQAAFATVPPCTGSDWRSDSAGTPGLTESWQLLDASGAARRVRIVLRSRHARGSSTDTVVTSFLCGSP